MENTTLNNKRFTKQRETILEILQQTTTHPDAHWIYLEANKQLSKISLATVYRNLNILLKENLINTLSFQSNLARYDGNLKKHFHIMCKECNKIEDIGMENINEDNLQECLNKVISKYNYTEVEPNLVFIGKCPECITKTKQPK